MERQSHMSYSDVLFLIVDDEPDMCWALQRILEKEGLISKVALTGQEALTLMRANGFHLAFLDAKLPDMEGLELAKRIRAIDPKTRVVLVSGYFYRDDMTVQKAFEDGLVSGFISKPFLNDEIYRIIESITGS